MVDPSAGGLSYRNKLINARGDINQRTYVSGTATGGANQYTVDRWRVVTSGQNLSWTASGNDRVFTAPAGGVEQVIEGVNLDTGTYALSWTGTASATVNGTSVANGATIALTGGSNATVRFTGGTFSLPQLELAGVTAFERRSYGVELALCQRYYWRQYGPGVNSTLAVGQCESTTRSRVILNTPMPMRIVPTPSYSAAADFNLRGLTTNTACSSITAGTQTVQSFSLEANTATPHGGLAGGAALLCSSNTTGWIDASAEL